MDRHFSKEFSVCPLTEKSASEEGVGQSPCLKSLLMQICISCSQLLSKTLLSPMTHTMCPVWDLSTFAHHHEFKMHPPPPILFLCGILSHSTTVGYQQLRGSLAHSCHWAFGLCLELLRAREPRSSDCCTSSFLVGAARLHFLWVNTEGCDVSVTEEGETFAPWTLPHHLAKWLDHFTSRSSE